MSHSDAEVRELLQQYHDVVPLDERREGSRYRARLADDTAVVVTALAADIASRLVEPGEFVARLRSVGSLAIEGIPRLTIVDRSPGGVLHFAREQGDAEPLDPLTVRAAELASAGAALARAVHTAHRAGVVHGAIVTERISLGSDGVQLDGLGLVDALHAAGMDRSEAVLALTDIAYVAPEIQDGAQPDARSDVYGLGAALYELLTGKAPFGGRTTSFVMATVLSDEEDEESKEKASGPVVDAILRAIEANPTDRWPDADAFSRALEVGAGSASASVGAASATGCLPRAAAFVALVALVASATALIMN
jgi:hypothetical protein